MNDFTVTPIVENGIGAEVEPTLSVDEAMAIAEKAAISPSPILNAALKALRKEVIFRWEQRTALSMRLQDLRHELVRAGIDDMSPLYEKFHSLTSTAEGWMHPGTLNEAIGAHLAALKRRIVDLETMLDQSVRHTAGQRANKDNAYLERNRVVAALATVMGSRAGISRTAIEGWDPAWHNCVYIDLPTGQASWHYHDDHKGLFDHLPAYRHEWDGHSTEEKHLRLANLPNWPSRAAAAGSPAKLPEVVYDSIRVQRHMKSGGYNVDVSTVSKVLDAVVRIADCDAIAAGPGDQG